MIRALAITLCFVSAFLLTKSAEREWSAGNRRSAYMFGLSALFMLLSGVLQAVTVAP